jgi:hypothetical protein
MSLVERVARALAAAAGDDPNRYWGEYQDDARAAIAAMREPTEAMVNVLRNTEHGILDDWHAMIDAALAE